MCSLVCAADRRDQPPPQWRHPMPSRTPYTSPHDASGAGGAFWSPAADPQNLVCVPRSDAASRRLPTARLDGRLRLAPGSAVASPPKASASPTTYAAVQARACWWSHRPCWSINVLSDTIIKVDTKGGNVKSRTGEPRRPRWRSASAKA